MSEHLARSIEQSEERRKPTSGALRKHPLPQRVIHWFNASCFLFLWLTGIGLITTSGYRLAPEVYTDVMAWAFGGPSNLLQAHVVVGVVWFTILAAAFIVDPWGLGLRFLRDLRFTSNDFRWFRDRLGAELRDDVDLPPQGAYNAGQKAFGLTFLVFAPLIGLTGIMMLIGTGGGPFDQWMVLLHLIAVGMVIAFLVVHVSMATLVEEERPALRSMLFGDVDEEYARHHHNEWYEKVKKSRGEHLNPLERFGVPKAAFRLVSRLLRKTAGRPARPLWSPYAAGALIGLSVLLAFVLLGHGLGASGLFSRAGANALALVAEDRVRDNAYWGPALEESFLTFWMLWLGVGTLIGGFVSAALGGRVKPGVDRGASISPRARILLALFGGALVGFATRLTRGCTSSQAITGGSLLSTGSWVFVLSVFAGGFMAAFFFRRVWR